MAIAILPILVASPDAIYERTQFNVNYEPNKIDVP
jgi:hypothetical protein